MAGKRDKWYRNLGERTVKRKCRRCGRKFAPPVGMSTEVCPPCRRTEDASREA